MKFVHAYSNTRFELLIEIGNYRALMPKYTVNVLPVFITVLNSVNLQSRKVLVIFTAFPCALTLSVKLGVQAKPVYITGKLTLLTNLYYCFFQ